MKYNFSLLDVVLYKLYDTGYDESDVEYVGTDDGCYASNWNEFAKHAAKVPHNDPRIYDFICMLKNGKWLERYRDEDDDIYYSFHEPPIKPINPKPLHKNWVK